MALDDCIQWIISLVERGDANAVGLSVATPTWPRLTTYEAPRRDGTNWLPPLRIELPRTPHADQILEAIDNGSGEDLT
jgi:hypothetical protein